MTDSTFRLQYQECLSLLRQRLAEPAPARIQLVSGPRQVGKTTLLLALASECGDAALYAAMDGPEASLPGFWERLWARIQESASRHGNAVLLLDEIQHLEGWSARIKGEWDRLRRKRLPVQVVATGSSALRLARGSQESLAGRFERVTLAHWSAAALSEAFGVGREDATLAVVQTGTYPGAFPLRGDLQQWAAYVRDAIVEPAIGRDILTLTDVRRPGLLRQVFAIAAATPARIVSLQKLQGQLHDAGALETIAHYLQVLEEAFLIAAIEKHGASALRRRAAPPKLIVLNNALVAAVDPRGIPDRARHPERFGSWLENACLAFAWNAGQRVTYWREEPLEVDGILEGSWGAWAVEVKTGPFGPADIRGLLEFVRRFPKYAPLVVCDTEQVPTAERMMIPAMTWQQFLLRGLAIRHA
jgi:predicted AAA+ superfamily ATPase